MFLIALLGATVARPLAVRAQQSDRMRRIGVLMSVPDPEFQANVAAFQEGLQKLGWAESRNIRIDYRWATPDVESIQRFAKELVALQPDRILTLKHAHHCIGGATIAHHPHWDQCGLNPFK
jgi:ABC-type uncharacterized transport system substrate-binding protein